MKKPLIFVALLIGFLNAGENRLVPCLAGCTPREVGLQVAHAGCIVGAMSAGEFILHNTTEHFVENSISSWINSNVYPIIFFSYGLGILGSCACSCADLFPTDNDEQSH